MAVNQNNARSANKCFRRVCITYQLEPEEVFTPPSIDGGQIRRWVGQLERGHDTGRLHLQAYVEFIQPVHFGTIKNMLRDIGLDGCHIESARGSWKQNYDYCTKEDTRVEGPWQSGDWTQAGQGRRSDIADPVEDIMKGKKLTDVANEHPIAWVKYNRGFQSLRERVGKDGRSDLIGKWDEFDFRWYYGVTQCGKTESVYAEFDLDQIYVKEGASKWWDGYEGHSVVLIDDYRDNKEFTYANILTLCQAYPFKGQTKGGHVKIEATCVIITSNLAPWDMWLCEKPDRSTPLTRRMVVKEFLRREEE